MHTDLKVHVLPVVDDLEYLYHQRHWSGSAETCPRVLGAAARFSQWFQLYTYMYNYTG